MNLTQSKLFLGITILLALLVLISLLLLSGRQQSTPEEDIPPQTKSELLFNQSTSEIPDPKLAIFDELKVGESTDADIERISGLKSKKETAQGFEYTFPSPLVDRDNIAVTKGGILIFKRFVTLKDVDHWEAPSMISYKEQYGTPELEKKGSVYYGAFEMLYLWASKGLAVMGNDFTDEVKEIYIFEPTSTDIFFQLWGEDSTKFVEQTPQDNQEEVAL